MFDSFLRVRFSLYMKVFFYVVEMKTSKYGAVCESLLAVAVCFGAVVQTCHCE